MDEETRGLWKPGRGSSIEEAAERAWEGAKKFEAEAGTYKLDIFIEVENPIRAYVVTIEPVGGGH
jgi:hypothetical protein